MVFGNCIELAIQFVYQSSSCLQVVNPPILQDSPLLDGSMLLEILPDPPRNITHLSRFETSEYADMSW